MSHARTEPLDADQHRPFTKYCAALDLEPRIAQHAALLHAWQPQARRYAASALPTAEYNVKVDVPACRKVFSAPWDITITRLDTCGIVSLHGDQYRRVRDAGTPLTKALMAKCATSGGEYHPGVAGKSGCGKESSTLFDTSRSISGLFGRNCCRWNNLVSASLTLAKQSSRLTRRKDSLCHWLEGSGGFEDLLVNAVIGAG